MANRLDNLHASSRLFALLAFVAVVAALYFAKEILLPLGLAVLLSFVLTPLVARLERLRLGRIPAVLLVVTLAFSGIGGVGWLATNQIVQLSSQLPEYKNNLIARIRSIRSGAGDRLDQATEAIQDIGEELTEGVTEQGGGNSSAEGEPTREQSTDSLEDQQPWVPWWNLDAPTSLPDRIKAGEGEDAVAVKVVQMPPSPLAQMKSWLGPLVAPLSTAGIVSVLVIFMLVQREDLRNRMIRLCGTSNLHLTMEAVDEAARRLSRYLRMQLLINTIYGFIVAVGLTVIGVPSPVLWGILGLMLRFLPYVGPWIAAVMPIMLSLAISDGWTEPLLTVGLFILLELVVNNVLEPWLYGSSIGVSSFGIIMAAIFWTWLWGPVGLVLAMPLTVCLVVLGNNVPQLSFLAVLLSDRSALEPPEHMYQLLLTANEREAFRLAEDVIESDGLIHFYGQVLIPALRLAEQDRHAESLTDQQESLIAESARELIEDLRIRHPAASEADCPGDPFPLTDDRASILCIPAEDRGDEAVAMILQQLLSAEGFDVEVNSSKSLAGETVSKISQKTYALIVLVALPPLGSRKARYLCRRLREHDDQLHIAAAVFDQGEAGSSHEKLLEGGANTIVHTLADVLVAARRASSLKETRTPKVDAAS